MKYVIRHETRGIYVEDRSTPHFSWTVGKSKGRGFETQAEAKEFIRVHFEQAVAGRCTVSEVKGEL